MKGSMGMESDAGNLGFEIQRLRRSVRCAQVLTLVLGLIVVALLVALAAVGASQHRKINNLRDDVAGNNVYLGSQSSLQGRKGATYAGSLFRGSGFWASRAVLPGRLTDHAAVGVSDGIFILGGAYENNNVTSQVLKYDPTLHTYTAMAPMPGPRYRFGATLLDNGKQDTIYVVGGRRDSNDSTTSPINELYIYSIPMNTWSIGPAAPVVMSDTCAGSVAGKVYAIGGYNTNYTAILNATYSYDPATKVWAKLANMPTARADLMCVSFRNEVYALGGFYDPSFTPNSFSDEVESFNPATGVWTKRPKMLTPRGDAGATVLPGNRIMVIGGEGHYKNNSTYKYPKHVNEIYYADDQTWVEKAFIPTARFRTAAASSGGLAYVIGGADLCPKEPCPALDRNEVFLDVDHPHVYVYLKNEAYNESDSTTTYPF